MRAEAIVIGGGPGGLMAAEVLSAGGASVTVIEQRSIVGRKLLLAGRSGLNLTNAEPFERLLDRFGADRGWLEPAIRAWGPDDLRRWADGLGQETFVGSSGRVFPKAMRAAPLLRVWGTRLREHGVVFRTDTAWRGWGSDGSLRLEGPKGEIEATVPDATVLALGGASWPRTGSDGNWVSLFRESGIDVRPLVASNAGLVVRWTEAFVERHGGDPLKNVVLTVGDMSARGEMTITTTGLEGGAVYAVGRSIRRAIAETGEAVLVVDLRPDVSIAELARRLSGRRDGETMTRLLRRAGGLSSAAIGLVRESSGNRLPENADDLAGLVRAVPFAIAQATPIDRAISTAGGVPRSEVDDHFMLRRRPGVFVVGEMLDWDAPTGGYLLQATLSTAVAAATGAVQWLGSGSLRTARDGSSRACP